MWSTIALKKNNIVERIEIQFYRFKKINYIL